MSLTSRPSSGRALRGGADLESLSSAEPCSQEEDKVHGGRLRLVGRQQRLCSHLVLLAALSLGALWAIAFLSGSRVDLAEHVAEEAATPSGHAAGEHRIPNQLIMMHKYEQVDQLPLGIAENVRKLQEMSPGMRLMWFGDSSCLSYIREHYDEELAALYQAEPEGSFRGDICRTAVLLREGGFYVDTDIQLAVPLWQLVDRTTSFMSVWCDAGVFNAMLAAPPGSPVVHEALHQIRRWYREATQALGTRDRRGIMGPRAYHLGLEALVRAQCPRELHKLWYHGEAQGSRWGMFWRFFRATGQTEHFWNADAFARPRAAQQWFCGAESLRLLAEEEVVCDAAAPSAECPGERASRYAETRFEGLRAGIFEPHPATRERRIVGWSRAVSCKTYGCGMARTPPPS